MFTKEKLYYMFFLNISLCVRKFAFYKHSIKLQKRKQFPRWEKFLTLSFVIKDHILLFSIYKDRVDFFFFFYQDRDRSHVILHRREFDIPRNSHRFFRRARAKYVRTNSKWAVSIDRDMSAAVICSVRYFVNSARRCLHRSFVLRR